MTPTVILALVAAAGVVLYALTKDKASEIGRLVFFAALLWLLLLLSRMKF